MSLQDRRILVKNDDISITYVGSWTTVQASAINTLGNFGPAFSPTLHSTTTISSFTFPFNGSSINVLGTVNIANSESINPDPTWQCSLDGINLGPPKLFQFPENNWIMCSQDITDGAHELVVNVTSQGMPFYLDYIEYQPSSSVSLENSLILFQNEDRAINYISGWSALTQPTGGANQTTDPEGLVNVTFVGTELPINLFDFVGFENDVGIQLSWYGIISSSESHNASSGEYSIDGQPYLSFPLLGLPKSTSATQYNQLFFATPTLEMEAHTLSAKYTGGTGQTPLTLAYLIVTNGSFPLFTNSLPLNSSGGAGGNGPASNSAPSMNAPSITTPSMNTPSITAPSMNTPSVNTSSMNTPSMNAPSMNTPSMNTPSMSTPSMNTPPVNTPPMNDTSKSSSHVGSIAGGVVGAVGGTVVCLILFFWLRSRKRRSRSRNNVRSAIEPDILDLVQPQFVSQAAPLLVPNKSTARSQGTSYTHQPSQPTMSTSPPSESNPTSSSIKPVPPYVTDATSNRPRRRLPAPSPPTQFIPSAPIGRTPTIAPIQYEDSGIRLPQSVLDGVPPAYSEL